MTDCDAIVVGARCAGSPTAMLLARRGYRVLLVDRATFPSDTLSTNVIHAPGVAVLRRWGLLDRVAATGVPPIERYSFDFGPVTIAGSPIPVDGLSQGYAPRRTLLDKILIDAAAEAGAEVREHYNVDELLFEDGMVTGIVGHGPDGVRDVVRARVVIGADGRNSHIARAVGAEVYAAKPKLQYAYYTYFSGLGIHQFQTYIRPNRGFGAIPTNDGLTLVVAGWPYAEASAYKADVERNFLATLGAVPEFAELMRDANREEPFLGGAVPNFFRKPYGPGWVLVGDAGYTKDPITAQGISDAFHDAEACASALDQAFTGARPFDAVMASYQRARDTRAMPIYEFTTTLATLEPPPEEMAQLIGSLHGNQAAMDAFVSVTTGALSPAEFFDPAYLGRLLAPAAPAGALA